MAIKTERFGKPLNSLKTPDLEKMLASDDKRKKHANIRKILAKRGGSKA